MTRSLSELVKRNDEKKMKNYLIAFSKRNCLNRSGINFHNFVFSELLDVAKYGCVRFQTGRHVMQKKYQGKINPWRE